MAHPVRQTRQPVLPHKTLGIRYPRYSPGLDGSQAVEKSVPPMLLNNNSSGHYTAMSASHTEEVSDRSSLSGDPLVDNWVACMICTVVLETLGFVEADELVLELPQGPQREPPQGPLSQVEKIPTDQ